MELSRRTIQRMILRKSGDTTVINQGSEGGGGGGGSVALGPLLTSLNAEAMPSAEGYLHWTGSAWAFDTPTGGDPVDLTPYALKTWVQDNFAYKNDLVNFITKTEADTYYAELSHTHDNYLPLSAGPNKALTDSLYFSGNSGINWAGGIGMLACTPESGWTGISSSQWGVGALSAQGVIRSNANDILHYRNGSNYKIWDAYNFTPSDYLPLAGGTVESLTVTNGLDADSITVSSLVNSDTLAEYLDADAMQTWLQQQGYITQTTADGRYIKGVSVYGSPLNPDTNRVVNIPYADINTPGVIQIGTGLVNDNEGHTTVDTSVIASCQWADGRYLPLTGGIVSYVYISNGHVGDAVGGIFNSGGVMTLGGESVAVNSDSSFTFNGSQVATQPWVTVQLGSYLPLTGGLLSNDLTIASNKYLRFGSNSGGLLIHNTTNGNNSLDISANRINLNVENGLFYNGEEVSTHSAIQNEFVAKAGSSMTGALSMGNGINVNFGDCSVTSNGGVQGNIQAGKILKLMGNYVAVTAGDNADANFTVNGNIVATRPWVTTQLGGYLPLTAGSSKPLTGNIAYKGTKATYDMITFIDNVGDIYGNGIAIGGGGATIIGGGESAGTMSAQVSGGNEVMYIGNDQGVSIFTNLQNGWDYRKEFTFHNTGVLSAAGSVVTPNGSGLYIKDTGGTERMAVFVNNSNQFFVGFGMRNAGYEGYFDSNIMYLRSGASGTTMTLDASNNVGIGTTSPQAKLDVNGSVKIAGSLTGVTTISTSSGIFAGGDIETKGSFVWCDSQNFGLTIMEGLAVSGDVNYCRALFRHKPQVQLGSDMLEVVVAKSDENGIEFRGSEDGTYTFGYGSGRGDIYAGDGDFTGNLTVGNRPAGADQKLYVGGSAVITGNIGIGTAPISTYAVDVDGSIHASSSVHASSFVNDSDIRMKDVIRYIEPSVHDIAIAPIIEFAWKKGDGSKNIGSIAQYWQTVFPQAVHEGGDGMLSMEYANIALASAITAARHSLDNERRIAELELRVAELAAMVSQHSETTDN